MPPMLQTERLDLRPFAASDADAAYVIFETDPDVWRHDPGFQRTPAERAAIVAKYAAGNDPEGVGTLAVVLRAANTLIGYVGLQHYILPRTPRATPEIELYYKFGRPFWGQGFAAEACRAMLGYAFDTLRLERIVTITAADNRESIQLLRRLGMQIEPAPSAWQGMLMATLHNDRPIAET